MTIPDLAPNDPALALYYFAAGRRPKPRRYPAPGDVAVALDAKTGTSPALERIDRELVTLVDGEEGHDALAIFLPPQEGKSQRASRRFPEWLLDHDSALRIAIVSYELDTALRWGRDIKQDIRLAPDRLEIAIRRDSYAAGRWETPLGGGVYCVGVGGPLTGRPVDILIVDDPVKDRAAAESETLRKVAWEWWESVALTRLAPGAKVVLIQTRWHQDDLAGRILSRPSPLRWKVLTIPAIAGDDDVLGREPGTELVSVRGRAPGYFRNLRATMSPYVFSGVYQQNPVAGEGNFFRRAGFRYWRPAPAWADGREVIACEAQPVTLADTWRFATIDVAASTRTSADYTVIAAWAVTLTGDLVLLDRVRRRAEMHDHFALLDGLRQRWRFDQTYIEHSFFASTLAHDARQAGIPVAEVRADTDKLTRAVPAAGRVASGKVWLPAEAPWLDEWLDEMAAFPQGTHDDQVDVLSYAVRVLVNDWTPVQGPPPADPRDYTQRMFDEAARSATGNGEIDFMNVPL